jgi:ATP-dependent protease ClpP protease subunit
MPKSHEKEQDLEKQDDIDISNNDDIVNTQTFKNNIHHIFLDDDIETPKNYRQVFNLLRSATQNDIINVVINTNGGDIKTTLQIHHYLMMTDATTVAEIHSAYSAVSLIALSCDNMNVAPYSTMMIHSITTMSFGKLHEVEAHRNFISALNENFVKQIYDTFLTTQEMESILSGKDIWLMSDEIIRRLKKWIPLRKRILDAKTARKTKNAK